MNTMMQYLHMSQKFYPIQRKQCKLPERIFKLQSECTWQTE